MSRTTKIKRAKAPEPSSRTSIDMTDTGGGTQPKLPHERDLAVGMTGGATSELVEQAHRDVERGLQDTSRAPEADAAYRKLKNK